MNESGSIDDDAELLALEKLLSAPEDELTPASADRPSKTSAPIENTIPRLREDPTFAEAFGYQIDPAIEKKSEEILVEDALDSSDDEEVKNFLERKYNEYGSDINKRIKQQKMQQHEAKVAREVNECSKTEDTGEIVHIKNPHTPLQRKAHVGTQSSSFKQAATTSLPIDNRISAPISIQQPVQQIYTDPVFGLRIIKPLISSTILMERMAGRKAVSFSAVNFHVQRGDLSQDWVIAGVLMEKNATRTTKKGDRFSIWKLSNLRGDIKMISLFLFQDAHKELWKTQEGMCVAILNPRVSEKNVQGNELVSLSIDTARKVMLLGTSKDFGKCRARKKNGDPCNSFVNLSECDYCVFHMKQEFSKMSRRSELQSDTTGRGLNALRNKVLGNSEVFYGGQSFTARPAKKSVKLIAKDNERLSSLSEYAISPFAGSVNHTSKPKNAATPVPYAPRDGIVTKCAASVEATTKQRLKDLERLKALKEESSIFSEHEASICSTADLASSPVADKTKSRGNSLPQTARLSKEDFSVDAVHIESDKYATLNTSQRSSSVTAATVPDKFKNRQFSLSQTPRLSNENFCIEVNVGARKSQLAKLKAKELLKKSPIVKINPNSLRGSKNGKRRAIDELNDKFNTESKRQKIDEDQKEIDRKTRIQRIMEASSSHANLVDIREHQEQEKYFSKMEKKEALEEKMLNTYKVPCKAVICSACKYTAFSAAERCKEERHPLKVIDAEKRFFQCKDCGNRTASLFKLPKISCKTCQGSNWERTAMIRERKVTTMSEGLSVRGDEEVFIGSLAGKANLNLLVAEE